jgi:hypothetical protein
MKKPITLGIWIVLFALIVLAAAPTTPPTIGPANESISFGEQILTCSGSTDSDGDPIYYEFYNISAFTSNINVSTTQMNWTDAIDYCSGIGTGWSLISVGSSIKNDAIYDNAAGKDYLWIGGNTFTSENNWSWFSTGEVFSNLTDCLGDYCNWATNYPITTVGNDFNCTFFCRDGTAGGICSAKEWANDGCAGTNKHAVCAEDVEPMQNTTSTTFNWTGLSVGTHEWFCKACDNSTIPECSSATENRTIYNMDFYNCTSGNISLNFSWFDEEDLFVVKNMTLDAALTLSSSTNSKTYNFALTGNTSYFLCLDPDGIAVNVTGTVEYDNTNSSYSYPRQYYFDDAEIEGGDQLDIKLYQLKDDLATAVTFNAIRDSYGVPDIIIHLQRYDPGTGVYTLVAMGETDSIGQDLIYLRLTDAWYRVLAYEDGDLIHSGDAQHIVSTTYNIYLSGAEGGYTDWWTTWYAFEDITYTLYYNETTNHSVLIADDSTGASTQMCLKVDKYSSGTIENICYTCESSASVTISCELVDQDAYYTAKFIAYHDSTWRVIDILEIELSTSIGDLIGKDGLVYAFLIIGLFAFAGLWNPFVAVTLSLVGLIAVVAFGFLNLAWIPLAGLLVAGGILLFKLKT